MNNVAVLMPTYCGIKYISKQINSIIRQKKVNVTLFISIDPSSDGTFDFLHNLSKSIKNIKIIKHYNNFGSPTKNFFNLLSKIDTNKFDYIGLADHDDIWIEDKLINGINTIKKNKIDCYSSSIIAFKNNKQKFIDKSHKQTKYDYYFESAGPGSTFLFKSTFVKKFQKFLKNNRESWNFKHYDWLIYSYARENNFKWHIDKNPTLYYRQHSNNFTGANWGLKAILARISLVISGEAFKQSEHLSRIIKYKKNFFQNNAFYILNFLTRAHQFRRKNLEKFFLYLYFISVFLFGKFENRTLIFSLLKVFRLTILASSIFSILYLLREFQSKNFLINEKTLSIFYILNLLLLIIISLRFFIFLNKLSLKKIKFINWLIIFIESQIISISIPYSNIVYRSYILKKKFDIDISRFIFLTLFILLVENLYILSILSIILLHYLNLDFLITTILFIILISIIMINLKTSEVFYFSFKIMNKLLKIFKFKFLSLEELKKVKLTDNFKVLEIVNFNILILLKLTINFATYYLISLYMNLELSISSIIIITLVNQMFELIKITPQNIGVLELVNGIFFIELFGLSIQEGIIFKLNHRIFEIFSIVLSLLIFKLRSYILSFSKKRNIHPIKNV